MVAEMFALKYSVGVSLKAPLGQGNYKDLQDSEWHRDPRLHGSPGAPPRPSWDRVDHRPTHPRACNVGWHAFPFSHWSSARGGTSRSIRVFLVMVKGLADLNTYGKGAFEYIKFVDQIEFHYSDISKALGGDYTHPAASVAITLWADWLELPKGSKVFWKERQVGLGNRYTTYRTV